MAIVPTPIARQLTRNFDANREGFAVPGQIVIYFSIEIGL